MPQTYSNNKMIYSVDMMFAYINLHLPMHVVVDVTDFKDVMDYKGWGDPTSDVFYSVNDVLDDPSSYPHEMQRIHLANLKFPIIVHNQYIVDGVHRLTKAVLKKDATIKAYVFDDALMKQFLLDDKGNWKKVNAVGASELIELFVKRKLAAS